MAKKLSPEEELLQENVDMLEAHAAELDQTLLDMVRGLKECRTLKKKKLKAGEKEEAMEDVDTGETVWVYTHPPHPALLKFALEQLRGRAAQKASQSAPVSITLVDFIPPTHAPSTDDSPHLPGSVPPDLYDSGPGDGPGVIGSPGELAPSSPTGDDLLSELLSDLNPE